MKKNLLVEHRPDLIELWDFEKNKGIDINKISINSHKVVWWKCDKHEGYQQEIRSKVKSNGCKCCNSRQLIVGFNDIASTNPKLANLMLNKEDAKKYMEKSKHRVDWKCPTCGEIIKNKKISDINIYGLSCPYCSDGISYGEKLFSNLLKELNIEFEFQKIFNWSKSKRYDFYLPKYNMIIEIHGKQHDNGGFKTFKNGKTLEDERINDEIKYNLAIHNKINEYIIIDAKESELNHIKNSILNSKFSKIFDISNINWFNIEANSQKSISYECLKLWNKGIKDIDEISKILNIHKEMVRRYLKRYANIGKCDYYKNKKTQTKIIQLDKNYNIIKEWNSMTEVCKYYNNTNRNKKIYNAINGIEKEAFGYIWMYKNTYDNFIKTGKIIIKSKKSKTTKKVVKLDLNGNYIETYNSIIEAARNNNIKSYNGITKCCKKYRNSCGGFMWMYEKEYKNIN